jgi:hypothetical protein
MPSKKDMRRVAITQESTYAGKEACGLAGKDPSRPVFAGKIPHL